MSRLKEQYQNDVAARLKQELELSNLHEVPRIEKVVLNVGTGRALQDARVLETAKNTLRKVTGQEPVTAKAKQSVAGFKLREGNEIGVKVTLRGSHMYEFLDRLITVVLPRTRDFRGLPEKSFDPQGNYSIGLPDQGVFPELTYEDNNVSHGVQINVITNSSPEHARALLGALGFPFERSENG